MNEAHPQYSLLATGDPAPWFTQRSLGNPTYSFNTAAGRYIVLCFFGSAADVEGRAALTFVDTHNRLFDDTHLCVYGVSLDPEDEAQGRFRERIPGIRFFLDFDGTISRLFGAVPREWRPEHGRAALHRMWVVLDPMLRVLSVFPLVGGDLGMNALLDCLRHLPPVGIVGGVEIPTPVLILPNVFEPEFCAKLISLYEASGGTETGFMREIEGKTVGLLDASHKRRRDYVIKDAAIIRETQLRFQRRIVPEIRKVHQFNVTRMERYIVSCYSAEDGGHFAPHRDNTTKGTAHRRFAVSINLNDDFDGGQLGLPEYGPRTFKMPPGGAAVFSCSLLHKVTPVTRGRRYAFLPFLYDDEAAKIRKANKQFIERVETSNVASQS